MKNQSQTTCNLHSSNNNMNSDRWKKIKSMWKYKEIRVVGGIKTKL